MYNSQEEDRLLYRKMNPKTLALMEEKGANLGKPCEIVNCFYAYSEDTSIALKALLDEEEYELVQSDKVESQNEPVYWSIHASIELLPTLWVVHRMTDSCVELAAKADAEYDSWYTEV